MKPPPCSLHILHMYSGKAKMVEQDVDFRIPAPKSFFQKNKHHLAPAKMKPPPCSLHILHMYSGKAKMVEQDVDFRIPVIFSKKQAPSLSFYKIVSLNPTVQLTLSPCPDETTPLLFTYITYVFRKSQDG
ncbi:uncharacterized protein LOC143204956 [Rhynchophorus ferrugineus]|uniref:uncharacterized protein LOC143204956 n=1 Tax=Rhynchophorus ferrugineus TaxID=354439 RepID=UPI003FCC5412